MSPKAAPVLPAPLQAAIEEFVTNQTELDRLEPLFDAVKAKNDELRLKLHEFMTDAGLTSIKTDSLGTFIRSVKGPYASIVDRDKAEAWAKEHGIFDTHFKFMPVSTRMSATISDILKGEVDIPLPEKGVVLDWVLKKTTSWRRPDSLAKKEKE